MHDTTPKQSRALGAPCAKHAVKISREQRNPADSVQTPVSAWLSAMYADASRAIFTRTNYSPRVVSRSTSYFGRPAELVTPPHVNVVEDLDNSLLHLEPSFFLFGHKFRHAAFVLLLAALSMRL